MSHKNNFLIKRQRLLLIFSNLLGAEVTRQHSRNHRRNLSNYRRSSSPLQHHHRAVIYLMCHAENLSSCESRRKYELISNVWRPPQKFKFPKENGTRGRSFQMKWLTDFPWLCYSQKLDAAFCIHCVAFEVHGGKNVNKTSALVKTPFRKWKNALGQSGQFENHVTSSNYHSLATHQFSAFMNSMGNKSAPINVQLNTIMQENITQKRGV